MVLVMEPVVEVEVVELREERVSATAEEREGGRRRRETHAMMIECRWLKVCVWREESASEESEVKKQERKREGGEQVELVVRLLRQVG
jgi:hypothetical protein